MGYLNGTTQIVDAILTTKGREKLSKGEGLNITQFALADDEIDYALYDTGHPKGSAFYDVSIRNMPVLEATPDESQMMKYKLVTLPKSTTKIPIVALGIQSIVTDTNGGATNITPSTSPTSNTTLGYTAILSNKNAGDIVGEGISTSAGSIPVFLGDEVSATAAVARGLTFKFIPNPNLTSDVSTTLTIVGNETGGSVSIPVTVTVVS